jgi:hypothetical protein
MSRRPPWLALARAGFARTAGPATAEHFYLFCNVTSRHVGRKTGYIAAWMR